MSIMSAVDRVLSSGTKYIDDLLTSRKWAGEAISFGFSQSASVYATSYGRGENKSFAALHSGQQKAALDAFAMWNELIALDLVQTNANTAEIRMGVSTMPSTAWAYTPSETTQAGDVWLGTTYLASPAKGNYAYLTIMHEIGHALGLAHPHEANTLSASGAAPDDGLCPCCAGALHGQISGAQSVPSAATASVIDAMAHTIMSYRSYEGQSVSVGYTNETYGYAQTPMVRDIAAIQYLYGANYNTRAGDTVYRWSESTGEKFINGVGQGAPGSNKVFEAIWDGGGRDTFDFSEYSTDLRIDLTPGGWSSFGNSQRANLGNGQVAPGNVAVALLHENNPLALIENAIGGRGNDVIIGNGADSVLVGGAGNDTLNGGAGRNLLVGDSIGKELSLIGLNIRDFISVTLPSAPAQAGNDILIGGEHNDIFIPGFGRNEVRGGAGTDTLVLDLSLKALKISGDPNGVMNIVHDGGSVALSGVEILAVKDGIFSLVGPIAELGDRQFVDEITLLYRAGLGRDLDAGGLDFWFSARSNGTDLDRMALSLIDSPEFADRFGTPDTMSDDDFVDVLYKNVLGREGEADGLAYWQDQIAGGATRADLLMSFAYSEENRHLAFGNHEGPELLAVTYGQWSQLWS
jgi:serralysin